MNRMPLKNLFFLLIIFFQLCVQESFGQFQIGADIDGEAAGDYSGSSVSMPDVNTLAIGAMRNDGTGADAGHVRIYSWNDTAWTQKGGDIDGEAARNRSGISVSMPDSNTVAIGALFNNGTGAGAGHVRIYSWNGIAWTQKGGDIDGEAAGDQSGYSVSMPDSNTVVIGAPMNDGIGSSAGHVRIYSWNGTTWTQKGADIDGEAAGDFSGWSVSMPDSNTVAIGAFSNDGTGTDAGHVRIYSWNGTAWTQKGGDIDGEDTLDRFGVSVSMPDSNTVAVGAHRNNGNGTDAGHVRIYNWNGTAWTQKGVDIDGEAANDGSGISVSMPDSNTVAIGAPSNDDIDTNAGHVRIYRWNGTVWLQKGVDIDGEAAGDRSGVSVSMPDSNTVAIGAPFNDGTGTSAGHVRIYSICAPDSSIDVQTACDSIIWIDSLTYTASTNTPTFTLTNVLGCDSVVTLDLTINSNTGTDVITACDSFTWIDSVTYTSSNNTATHTLTNAAGCDSVVTLDLTINSNTGTDVIAACDSFTWIDSVTYTSSNNTATHTLTNAAGCDSVVTLDLTINSIDTSILENRDTLTANQAGADYQWLNCDSSFQAINGETIATFIATVDGNYACEITLNGCTDTTACIQVIITGIAENDISKNFRLFPNPFSEQLTITTTTTTANTNLEILNIKGQKVYQGIISLSGKTIINTADWAKGVYFIRLTNDEGVGAFKVVHQ